MNGIDTTIEQAHIVYSELDRQSSPCNPGCRHGWRVSCPVVRLYVVLVVCVAQDAIFVDTNTHISIRPSQRYLSLCNGITKRRALSSAVDVSPPSPSPCILRELLSLDMLHYHVPTYTPACFSALQLSAIRGRAGAGGGASCRLGCQELINYPAKVVSRIARRYSSVELFSSVHF
jgi:hypothetical protein